MAELVNIRRALLEGDLRILYLAWLASAYAEDCRFDWEATVEPPVPPNLKILSPALEQFTDIFEISADLVTAAATQSETISDSSEEPVEAWIAELPESERNDYLLRVAKGENHVGLELMQQLRQQFGGQPAVLAATAGSRTFAELKVAAKQKSDGQARKEQAEAERAEQQRIKALVPQVDKVWQLVHHLIERGQAKTYDEAIAHLMDLQAISELQGEITAFDKRVKEVEETYGRKRSLISRLKKANLI